MTTPNLTALGWQPVTTGGGCEALLLRSSGIAGRYAMLTDVNGMKDPALNGSPILAGVYDEDGNMRDTAEFADGDIYAVLDWVNARL